MSIKLRATVIGKTLFLRTIRAPFVFHCRVMQGLFVLLSAFGNLFASIHGVSLALDSTHVNQVLREKCSGGYQYTMTCLKLDSLRLLLLLGNETQINLGPGIALVGTEATASLIDELDSSLINQPRSLNQLDDFVFKMLRLYLGSLNLTFQLRDSHVLDDAVSYLSPKTDVTGRAKKHIGIGWVLLGTVAAVGFAVLAALTGAGLTAAILALILSGIASFRGGAGGFGYGYGMPAAHPAAAPSGRITSFEFIKPAYVPTGGGHYILDHEHHHTAAYTGAKRGVVLDPITAADEQQGTIKRR